MTTSTTDAEAIARIIDPNAVADAIGYAEMKGYTESETQELIKASARIANAIEKATAILSYLTSRREAQEPVAWRYRFITSTKRDWSDWFIVDDAKSIPNRPLPDIEIQPLYTAPPAPAGEVERLRSALEQFEGRIKKYIAQLKATGQADVANLLRRDVDCLRAAINGGRE